MNVETEKKENGETIVINQQSTRSNGVGTVGFALALFVLLSIFLGWFSVFVLVLWILGLIFSIVGMFRKPKGLAIAGLVISLIVVILLGAVLGAVLAGW